MSGCLGETAPKSIWFTDYYLIQGPLGWSPSDNEPSCATDFTDANDISDISEILAFEIWYQLLVRVSVFARLPNPDNPDYPFRHLSVSWHSTNTTNTTDAN